MAIPKVLEIGAKASGPAIRYHGVCLILWFQPVWLCWAMNSL